MKFYLVQTRAGETIDCRLTLREAREEAESMLGDAGFSIQMVEAEVTAETVRRLLGDLGGYARSTRAVVDRPERAACPKEDRT